MRFVKPPFFHLLQRFRNQARRKPAASLLIAALLVLSCLPLLADEDEFGLEGPAVPSRLVRGEQESGKRIATLAGTISSTFSGEMSRKNMSALAEKVKGLLASRVDLDGASVKGASYRILYEERRDDGLAGDTGEILAVEVSTAKQRFNAYRFTNARGRISYYDERGGAVMDRPLFLQPCDYERVSSEFGYRRHPISRLIRFHGGVDLAAPSGTPVRAVADGTVAFSGRNGGAGNMVTISHNGGMATQYLHLSRVTTAGAFGSRIRQGDVIGYVGSTGSSTGPHLDFRVIVDGMLRDPLATLKTQAPKRSLTPAELSGLLAKIDLYRSEVDNSLFRVAGISNRPAVSL
ncbi:MAG: M23 family metallopeptidase [Chlorobiaceae bacterium]|nr:M23 family metallopeptidase [Chlorobiaceae bacterium]